MKILITGSHGFIGKKLTSYLEKFNYKIFKLSLDIKRKDSIKKIENSFIEFKPDIVIHVAGLAHKKNPNNIKSIEDLININTTYTFLLTCICKKYNIQKFIFISSIGVHGAKTYLKKINEDSPYLPYNAYSLSKVNAEKYIIFNLKDSSTNYTIIRPSLVIGKNAPGNIAKIKKLLKFNIPLPLNDFSNKRHLLYIQDLCNLVEICINEKKANNQIFVAASKKELTPREIFSEVAKLEGMKLKSFYLPKILIFILFIVIGKKDYIDKLKENLLVSSKKARNLLNWDSII